MRYLLFFVLLVSLSCNNRAADQTPAAGDSLTATVKKDSSSVFIHKLGDTVLLSRIEDTLLRLAFVKISNDYIDSFSNHRHGIAFIADTAGGLVTVSAGYNGPERFETYYNFTVNPKTFEIRIMDFPTGEYISLEQYSKENKE